MSADKLLIIDYSQSFVVEHLELVSGESLDARATIDQLGLVAELALAGTARARLTLHGERHLARHLRVQHDDVETRLDVLADCRVAQLRHPLTVSGNVRVPTPVLVSRSRWLGVENKRLGPAGLEVRKSVPESIGRPQCRFLSVSM